MNTKLTIAAIGLAGMLALSGCTAVAAATTPTTSSTSSSSTTDATATQGDAAGPGGVAGGMAGGPGGGVDATSLTTEEELVALIQDAYGDGGLGLHRGHQPVESILDEVLGISHDELHVRMDAGQNLATIADEVGVGAQTLIDAMVASRSVAIDNLLAAGTITQEQADAYLEALQAAFTFRVSWDGVEATPTFTGIEA